MLISDGIVFGYQQVFLQLDSLYHCSLCTLAVIFLFNMQPLEVFIPVNLNDFDILKVLSFNKNNTTKRLNNGYISTGFPSQQRDN